MAIKGGIHFRFRLTQHPLPYLLPQKMPPKKARPGPMPKPPSLGDAVEVLWQGERRYYRGVLTRQNNALPYTYLIFYDDGDREIIDLDEETWHYARPTHRAKSRAKFTPGDLAQLWPHDRPALAWEHPTLVAARISKRRRPQRDSDDSDAKEDTDSGSIDDNRRQTAVESGKEKVPSPKCLPKQSKAGSTDTPKLKGKSPQRKISKPLGSMSAMDISRLIDKVDGDEMPHVVKRKLPRTGLSAHTRASETPLRERKRESLGSEPMQIPRRKRRTAGNGDENSIKHEGAEHGKVVAGKQKGKNVGMGRSLAMEAAIQKTRGSLRSQKKFGLQELENGGSVNMFHALVHVAAAEKRRVRFHSESEN